MMDGTIAKNPCTDFAIILQERHGKVAGMLTNLDSRLTANRESETEKCNVSDILKTLLSTLSNLSKSRIAQPHTLAPQILKEQIQKLRDGLGTERVARELLEQRKNKELQLVESSVMLSLNEEKEVNYQNICRPQQ